MPVNKDAMARYRIIDRMLADPHYNYTTKQIEKAVSRECPKVSTRMIQKDIKALEDFGKELSEAAVKRVAGIAEDLKKKLEKEGLGEVRNCITVDTAGKDSVTLNMNGVTLAYVVAGEDGKIRSMGNGIAPGDRQGLKLASALHESLKGCTTVDDWVGVAERICLSRENILAAREGVDLKRRLEENKKTRLGILNASKASIRHMHAGLKI